MADEDKKPATPEAEHGTDNTSQSGWPAFPDTKPNYDGTTSVTKGIGSVKNTTRHSNNDD